MLLSQHATVFLHFVPATIALVFQVLVLVNMSHFFSSLFTTCLKHCTRLSLARIYDYPVQILAKITVTILGVSIPQCSQSFTMYT